MTWLLLVVPIFFALLGFPIFVTLLTACMVILVFVLDLPLSVVHQVMLGSVDKFALMAVPFFFFAGELMARGGISRRIVDWVQSLIGGVRGSLGLTTVGTCTVFGAISGSSPATVAAVGRLLHPSLRQGGYPERFSSALIASSGGIAVVIPPSVAMILYGASAEQAVNVLFIAGFIPGLLLALCMALYVYIYSVRQKVPRTEGFRLDRLASATRSGVWALLTPVIILGGIYSGVFSPTEAAGVASLYAIIVTTLIYRTINLKGLWEVAVNSIYLTAQIFIIVAAAGVFAWLLTITRVPQSLVDFIKQLDVQPWMVLLAINVLLLLVGALIDPASSILVMTPLLVPIAKSLDVDLIHFGIIMVINIEIGMFTPPFGLNIFVAQALFRTPLLSLYKGLLPFIAVNISVLLVITYVPEVSLFLTQLLK